jgi:hypothetical protein
MAFVGVLSTQLLWEQLVVAPAGVSAVDEHAVGTRIDQRLRS